VTIDAGVVTPVPDVDVAVTDVSAAASVVVQGDAEVSVDVTVQNVGNDAVGSFNVTLMDVTDNVDIGSQTVTSLAAGLSTTLTYSWSVPLNATVGDHTLEGRHNLADENDANDDATTVVTVNELTVGTAPLVSACDPDAATRNDRLTVLVIGSNFVNGATVSFGQQVQVRDVSFTSVTQLDVQIRVNRRASFGPRDVTVTNPDGQTGTLAACFTVNEN
jgi:hypothetical protein